MAVQVDLLDEHEREWRFKATLPSGKETIVTVLERARRNRRETVYEVCVGDGRPWQVIVLSMPNAHYAWRIDREGYRDTGEGSYHGSPFLALRDGAVPYIVAAEHRIQPPAG